MPEYRKVKLAAVGQRPAANVDQATRWAKRI